MTEDEAKTKWCPFARVSLPHADECGWQGPANRDPYKSSTYNGANCIGSACMAYRWEPSTKGAYCGLAGKL